MRKCVVSTPSGSPATGPAVVSGMFFERKPPVNGERVVVRRPNFFPTFLSTLTSVCTQKMRVDAGDSRAADLAVVFWSFFGRKPSKTIERVVVRGQIFCRGFVPALAIGRAGKFRVDTGGSRATGLADVPGRFFGRKPPKHDERVVDRRPNFDRGFAPTLPIGVPKRSVSTPAVRPRAFPRQRFTTS